ncbi:MAG: OmpA family protein [Bacteroidota bacterium]
MNTKIILPITFTLLWIAFCAFMSSYRCCGFSFGTAQEMTAEVAVLSLSDQGQAIASVNRSFAFSGVSSELSEPIPIELQTFISKVANYLQSHPERRLVVTGLYSAVEKNKNANLGLARAARIESLLLDKSVPAIQIKSKQDMSEAIVTEANLITNALRFDFDAMPPQTELLKEMQTHLNAQEIVLYFDLDKKELRLTPAQRKFFEDLRFYLDKNERQQLSVIGFTDNTGQPRQNKRLGRERATFVRDFLIDLGIPRRSIVTESRGEANPIGDNETEAGRAKNRRVEVMLIGAKHH